uniref:ACB domain-containing protein n=1 Tax=Rhizophora mucronata TaxID=61149 RepID=A0A2P2JBR8_RHIMU
MVPILAIAVWIIAICLVLSFIIDAILVSLPAREKRGGLDSKRKPKRERKVKAETAKKEDRGSKTKRKRGSKSAPVVEECESTQTLQEFSKEVPKIQTKEVDLIGIEEKHNGHGIGCGCQVDLIDQRAVNHGEIEGDLMNEEVGIAESREIDGGLVDEEGDWEGVESTELERLFGAAAVFVGSRDNVDKISSLGRYLNLQLYGLHKIAIEGPCHVPQPTALNLSARAKWNAWRQLGDMSREVAMELYISVLSSSIPGWMGEDCRDLALPRLCSR